MLSMKEAKGDGSTKSSVAVYKGLTVTVYDVDKTDLTLTRRDLIDLINVCRHVPYSSFCLCPFYMLRGGSAVGRLDLRFTGRGFNCKPVAAT